MLLLGVVGAAVGREAGNGVDSLGFRGLLCLVLLSVPSVAEADTKDFVVINPGAVSMENEGCTFSKNTQW